MSPITTAVMSTVPVARAGMASAHSNTMRQVGGVFGIAVLGSIVTSRFSPRCEARWQRSISLRVADQVAEMAQQGRGRDIPSMPGLDVAAIETAVKDSFTAGLHRAVWVAGACSLREPWWARS